jgi:hypothetical protein
METTTTKMRELEHEQWDEAKALKAVEILEEGGRIKLCETNSPQDVEILDRILFAARPDASLYVRPFRLTHIADTADYSPEFVEALAQMNNLRRLSIWITPNQKLSPLSALSGLTKLWIFPRGNVSMDFVSGMTNLETLRLEGLPSAMQGEKIGGFKSYDPLRNCKSLKNLVVIMVSKPDFGFAEHLPIEDLILCDVRGHKNEAALFGESLKQLELTLMSSFGDDMSLLGGCSNLEDLTLNQSKNIKSLSGLDVSSLKRLKVDDMASLTDFSVLRQAKELKSLDLQFLSTKINVKELYDILMSMDSLEEVKVSIIGTINKTRKFRALFAASPKAHLYKDL